MNVSNVFENCKVFLMSLYMASRGGRYLEKTILSPVAAFVETGSNTKTTVYDCTSAIPITDVSITHANDMHAIDMNPCILDVFCIIMADLGYVCLVEYITEHARHT